MLEIQQLCARYDDTPVFRDVGFSLPRGDIGALLGPSGSGKTTLLRIVAGLEAPDSGCVLFAGEQLNAPGVMVPPEQRGFAMIFQDLALLPHLNVLHNVMFALHRLPRGEARKRAREALGMVALADYARRMPHQLSGGQLQRVAVARAIAGRPRLLLMDEPFSSLDEELRAQLREELRALLKQLGMTALLVTHSQLEAYALGDWVGMLSHGRLHQWDTPYNLYHRPVSRFVADFVGEGVFVAGTSSGVDCAIATELGDLKPSPGQQLAPGPVDVLLRPDDVIHDDDSPWQARIVHKVFRGAEFMYEVELPSGTRLLSLVPSHHNHRVGEDIGIRLNLEHVVAFARESSGRPTPTAATS